MPITLPRVFFYKLLSLVSPYKKKKVAWRVGLQQAVELSKSFSFHFPYEQSLWFVSVPWLKVRAGISPFPPSPQWNSSIFLLLEYFLVSAKQDCNSLQSSIKTMPTRKEKGAGRKVPQLYSAQNPTPWHGCPLTLFSLLVTITKSEGRGQEHTQVLPSRVLRSQPPQEL